MFLNYDFGNALKNYLKVKGIKQTWLAEKMGISSQAVIKQLKATNPRQETISKILSILEVSLEELMKYDNIAGNISEPNMQYQKSDNSSVNISMEQFQYFMEAVKERDALKQKEIEKLQDQNQGVTPQTKEEVN